MTSPATADLCLGFDTTGLSAAAWAAIAEAAGVAVHERPLVFPSPTIVVTPGDGASPDAGGAARSQVTVWSAGASVAEPGSAADGAGCLVPGSGWSAVISLTLLQGAAERSSASAGLPANVTTRIDVELVPSEDRVRTTLVFTGDFGIGGTCGSMMC